MWDRSSDDRGLGRETQYSFVDPNGEAAGFRVFRLWDGPPPPADHRQMVEDRASIELDADTPLGDHQARIKVCRMGTERCVTADSTFRELFGQGSDD